MQTNSNAFEAAVIKNFRARDADLCELEKTIEEVERSLAENG